MGTDSVERLPIFDVIDLSKKWEMTKTRVMGSGHQWAKTIYYEQFSEYHF